jgi:hypothetical protein
VGWWLVLVALRCGAPAALLELPVLDCASAEATRALAALATMLGILLTEGCCLGTWALEEGRLSSSGVDGAAGEGPGGVRVWAGASCH